MPIYFYGVRTKIYGCFSNFSPHGFELDGYWWPTNEHYFQAQKFATTDRLRFLKNNFCVLVSGLIKFEKSKPQKKQLKWGAVENTLCD